MRHWDYMELVQVVDAKTGEFYWHGHQNWKMNPLVRLLKFGEKGWELVSTYTIVQKGQTEVHFILKQSVK